MPRKAKPQLKCCGLYPGEFICLVVLLALLSLGLYKIFGSEARGAEPATIQPGSFLFSRWVDEGKNTSPGFWNHDGVISRDGFVIEALIGASVVKSPLTNYSQNPELRYVILPPPTPWIGERIAWYAETQLGKPYRRTASIGPGWIRNLLGIPFENCTSLGADSFRFGTGRPLLAVWRPDDLYACVWHAYRPTLWPQKETP